MLKTKLQQSQQSQRETDAQQESQQVLSELQQVNNELLVKCFELELSSIMDKNTFTSMTIHLLMMGKCTNTDLNWNWKDREIITLIRVLQIPFVGVGFIQHHCLPRKFLQYCPSRDHSYLILTFLFFRLF